MWNSPYTRCRRTTELFLSQICGANIRRREDPRLREQDWGNFYTEEEALSKKENRKEYGKFFYRFEQGESGADVYARTATCVNDIYRESVEETNTIVIITHGITGLILMMHFLDWGYEQFENANSLDNGDFIVLKLDERSGRYEIARDSRLN